MNSETAMYDMVGAQPVSMDRENMKLLSKLDYCVCEKTDGVRYMLLIWNVLWSEYLLIL